MRRQDSPGANNTSWDLSLIVLANKHLKRDSLLQGLLQNDGIHFSIFPVASYGQVRKIFETQLNRDEVGFFQILLADQS